MRFPALAWLSERLLATRLAASARARQVRAFPFTAISMRILRGRSQAPHVVLVPQELRTADPVRADEFIGGVYVFAGQTVSTSNPFTVPVPSEEWMEALAGFSWLRHLRSAGTPEAGEAARRLVMAWMEAQGRSHPVGWQPQVMAERLKAWLATSGLLLAGAEPSFYRRFARSLWRQMRLLQAQYAGLPPGAGRLSVLIALVTAGLCIEGEERMLKWASRRLVEELDQQILADGGHISRNPGVLVGLILDLLPLRQLFPARNVTPPTAILTAVDRMMPMVRFLQFGDGSLARFNGMGPTAIDLVATALVYDESRGHIPPSAPHSGFERLEAGRTVIIVDTGHPPPAGYSIGAHAGTLSFELSAGRQMLVVNCGATSINRSVWRREARKTAAHSTVSVADRSSMRFAARGVIDGAVLSGPGHVAVSRRGLTLTAVHDGYRSRFGVEHSRTMALAEDGLRLDGEDSIEGAGQPYAVRFHLHSLVQAIPTENGRSVLLVLPAGEAWVFAADQPVSIEPSVSLAMAEGPRRASQLVIEAHSAETPRVRWGLRKLDRPAAPPPPPEPELPL